jgi:anion-transporting  ArsA/GET3 family ATPase
MNALIAVILGAITVYLTYTRYARRMGQAQQRLTDEQKTVFFFVTLPEVPIHRLVPRLRHSRGRRNRELAAGQSGPGSGCAGVCVRNRVKMQEEYMKSIWGKFDGSVRALVPLFDREVRGCSDASRRGAKLMT